jgi:hypothetical protein
VSVVEVTVLMPDSDESPVVASVVSPVLSEVTGVVASSATVSPESVVVACVV